MTTKLYRRWKRALPALDERRNLRTVLTYVFVAAVYLLAVLPVFLRQSDGLYAVHDNLDSIVAYFKMLRENGLFFALDAPTPMLHGVSTLYFSAYAMNLLTLIFACLNTFRAYLLAYALHLAIGYFSMALLLCYLFPRHKNLMRMVSIAYALTPVVTTFWISFAAVPLVVYAFLRLASGPKRLRPGVLWLLCYLPFSSFGMVGIFLVALWLAAAIVLWIVERKPNWNLLAGFLLLCLVSVVSDYKLFYMALFDKTPLIRESFVTPSLPLLKTWWEDFTQGMYHAPPFQRLVLLPTILAGSLAAGISALARRLRARGTDAPRSPREGLFALVLLAVAGLFSLVYALYYDAFWNELVAKFIPLLGGFNWSRLSMQNRVVFFVAFAAALCVLSSLRIKGRRVGVPLCALLVTLQVAGTLLGWDFGDRTLHMYNIAHRNLCWEQTRAWDPQALTWREFYGEKLFADLKEDIGYQGEYAVALGFHPAVLTYNGFATLDGYLSIYPLAYKEAFGALIAPELAFHPAYRSYFEGWGARAYLFNYQISYEPTRWREAGPVSLRMDMDEFRALGGTYVISRAEVENAGALGLTPLGRYDRGDIYILYVYQTDDPVPQ